MPFARSLVLALCLAAPLACAQQPDESAFSAHAARAQQALREHHPEQAIPELQAAVAIHPNNVELQANLGVLLFFQNHYSESIAPLRAALALNAALYRQQGILGVAEARTGDPSAAADMAAALPHIDDPRLKAQIGLELVSLRTAQHDLEAAASTLVQLERDLPTNPEILYAAYRTYNDLTIEAMLALAVAAPDSAQVQQMLAHELIRQGKTNDAAAAFDKALQLNPHLPGIHFELAELYRTGKGQAATDKAAAEFRLALSENPLNERALCRLGEIDDAAGRIEQADAEFARALELNPADGNALLGRANTRSELNQPADAEQLLERTIQIEPTNATAHYRLGILYRRAGRLDDAKHQIELYKQLKDVKERLTALYKSLQVVPAELDPQLLEAEPATTSSNISKVH